MPKQELEVLEGLDKLEGMGTVVTKLPQIQYRNFLVEGGRFVGQKVVLHFFHVPMKPEVFQELLTKHFENRLFPPEIYFEPSVLLGSQRDRARGSHTVLWRTDLSDNMLAWVKRKVAELDRQLSQNG